jgi:tetratricopeptide (TPR) repeat protein
MKPFLVVSALAALAAAQSPEKSGGDACAPKPSQYAPALPAKLMEGMGRIDFPITTNSPEAQKFFNQGVAQMHSFWFAEAERSFRQAAALDPEAPMPQWGIAMTAAGDFRPRFQLQDGDNRTTPNPRARDAANRARELAAIPGKATELERMYVDAVAARRMDGDDAFVKALRALVAKFSKEVEARSYLALMIMKGFTLPDRKPRTPETMEAVAILRDLMKEAPDHPGVHHYVIHGFEGSTFANEAWHSCERYAALVPNIPHALHMPGHIYSQTARWADAVKSFEAAAENERGYMRADSLYGSGHHAHNVHYLATSYAFSGDYDKALGAARELLAIPETPREAGAADNLRTAQTQGFFSAMRAMVQFRKWEDVLSEKLPRPVKPRALAWYHWARALALFESGNPSRAAEESASFEQAVREHVRIAGKVHPSLDVARAELKAHAKLARGDWKRARGLFEKASDLERSLRYNEPPAYPRPVAEALGHIALGRGETQTAERAFRIALEQFPADWHAESALRALTAKATRAGL